MSHFELKLRPHERSRSRIAEFVWHLSHRLEIWLDFLNAGKEAQDWLTQYHPLVCMGINAGSTAVQRSIEDECRALIEAI